MKKAIRKLTSLMLALIVLLSALPMDVLAEALPAAVALPAVVAQPAAGAPMDRDDDHADPDTIHSEPAEDAVNEREAFELGDEDGEAPIVPSDADNDADDVPPGKTTHILGDEPFSIHVAPLARSVFAGDALTFSLSWEGDLLPREIRVTVTQDGEILYVSDALTDTVTVVPADTGNASTIALDVAMTDAEGYITHAGATVPCAVHSAERAADWEAELHSALTPAGE